MIRHVVLMKFTEAADAMMAKTRLEALPDEIAEILSLEAVLDVLRSDASYDLALVTTHESLDALRAYQVHPAHEAFLAWLRPRLTARAVVDAEI